MLRLTGILIGSALAVAVIIIVLGMPEFVASQPEPDQQLELPVQTPAPTPVSAAEVEITEPQLEEEALPSPDETALVDAIFTPAEERDIEVVQENWYAFWSPFRSEIAADGFVEQLQRTTGLDYRVVKQKPGVYEVAFAYGDEDDIQSNLDVIAAATGLEMPDG